MNWIDHTATRIAKVIRENYESAASEKVLYYALSLLINTSTAIFLTLIIAFFTNHLLNAIIAVISFLLIRNISGGFHLRSSLACCVFSTILLITFTHSTYKFTYLGYFFNFISLLIMLFKAPFGIENFSKIQKKHYPYLKIIAVLAVTSNFFIQSSLLASVYIGQSLTLSTLVYKLVTRLEGSFYGEKENCKIC
ncbi:accessory gene regulator B family protein [Paenibacillus mucilaginosus]|uniref:accessory gene regulator B family protein n=1 Tax=Paenibacillus mucilaginosus TaxID=61624 RepID=UPI0009DB136E|nr:accessory gene regulator B family protein [Paenibacillus mucilaginosus]